METPKSLWSQQNITQQCWLPGAACHGPCTMDQGSAQPAGPALPGCALGLCRAQPAQIPDPGMPYPGRAGGPSRGWRCSGLCGPGGAAAKACAGL